MNIKLFLLKKTLCLQDSGCQAIVNFKMYSTLSLFGAIVILLISVLIAGASSLPTLPQHTMMSMTERSLKR